MNADLYARIVDQLGATIAGVFDVKLPDAHALSTPVVVVSGISDVPTTEINSTIVIREQRLTCEIQALDLVTGRPVKEALIAALHGWSEGTIGMCELESGGPELYDWEMNPPRYCLPVDFMVML